MIMGADQFTTRAYPGTLQAAFDAAHEEACYDFGHAGYTGSIAEKGSAVEFTLPTTVTLSDALDALNESYDYMTRDASGSWVTVPAKVPDWAPSNWARIAATYNDKWGPAVGIHTPEGWVFTGWASC